jgi:hypothetical protein
MKLSKPNLLPGVIVLLCALGTLLIVAWDAVALESSRAFLLLLTVIFAAGAYQIYVRERKARAAVPVKIQREEPPVVIRRRPDQW